MTYNLGIDIGIASIGFAGVDISNQKILFCGAHIFEAAENPKDGASLAAPRREKRALRRVIHRRSLRKKAVRRLLAEHGLRDIEMIDLPEEAPPGKSVWDLRKEALERKLTDAEFARILFHIAKRRGFQSNRKGAPPNDIEGKKALNGAKELQEAMTRANALTVGAYLASLPKKRNGDGSYDRFVTRELLREEVRKIFEAQRGFGNEKATPELLLAYAGDGDPKKRNTVEGDGIAFYQKPLQSSEHLVGFCTFEEGEKRAPKFSYTGEMFVLWSKLNHTKVRDKAGNERALTPDEKNRLAEKAHVLKSVSYKQARKELDLPDDERFNISYRKTRDEDNSWEKIRDAAEKNDFLKLPGYHALKEALDTGSAADWHHWIGPGRSKLDDIARILSFYEDPKQIDEMLSDLGLDENQRKKLAGITSFKKSVDLSLKAIRKILPFMQEGLVYSAACEKAGYDHSRKENKGLEKIPPFDDIRNPVVNRALAQARKVINACIRKYGLPETIIVELARDIAKPKKGHKSPTTGKWIEGRSEIEKKNLENRALKTRLAEELVSEGIVNDPNGEDILKYRLWKEQDGCCPYSGVYITPEMLRDSVATQIDHIIPYSRSWNDSYMNKVLCLTSENQNKGNDTPLEYFRRSGKNPDGLEAFARKLPPRKAENLLTENFDEEKAGKWKDRALNDTRYMARALKNHLEQSLALGNGNRVQTRNGALTANLRGAWGLNKTRENDRHHAVDAIVLACSTQGMVQRHTNWNRYEARRRNPAQRTLPPAPWETFREDTMAAVFGPKGADNKREGGIFVSRMPVRKVTGAAHQETIRSIRKSDGKIIQRIKISGLKLPMLENLVDKDGRNKNLYSILKSRLEAHQGNPQKAFAEPVRIAGKNGPGKAAIVNSVRIETSEKSGIVINKGLASNGDMVRVDVFQKDGKFQLVPVYVHHFAQGRLPNKAIVAFKDEKDWLEVEDKDFLFSLYRNDFVFIRSKKEEILGYYVGTHRGTGCINIRAHDSDPSFGKDGVKEGLGVKTLLAFHKYSVDYFGDKHRIEKERRLGVAHGDDSEPGEAEPFTGTVAGRE